MISREEAESDISSLIELRGELVQCEACSSLIVLTEVSEIHWDNVVVLGYGVSSQQLNK